MIKVAADPCVFVIADLSFYGGKIIPDGWALAVLIVGAFYLVSRRGYPPYKISSKIGSFQCHGFSFAGGRFLYAFGHFPQGQFPEFFYGKSLVAGSYRFYAAATVDGENPVYEMGGRIGVIDFYP